MRPIKTAVANIAPSQTDSNIITAKPGVIMLGVAGWAISAGTATNLTLNSKGTGSGTAITSLMPFGANGGVIWPASVHLPIGDYPIGYFQTNKGEGLSGTTGSGSTVGITVRYIEVV